MPLTLAPLLLLQAGQITGPEIFIDSSPAPTGQFGNDVAMDVGLMVVGAPGSSSTSSAMGSVSVYRLGAMGWQLDQLIDAPAGIGANARFGDTVDVTRAASGEYIIVGAPRAQLAAGGIDQGAAFVYEFTDAGWSLTSTLTGDSSLPGFGDSVTIDESTAAIGQADFDGRAFVASRGASGLWQLDEELSRPGTVFAGADFGASIDMERDLIVVGAPGEDAASYDSGAAYVYRRSSPGSLSFSLEVRLEHPSATTLTAQGTDVAVDNGGLSADRVVVGSQDEKAFVWRREPGTPWAIEQLLTPFDGETGGWGRAVAIEDARIVVGAPWRVGSASGSGAAMSFQRRFGGVWSPTGILHPGLSINESVATSVAIGGTIAAVGAPRFDGQGNDSGAALLYSLGFRLGEAHCAGRINSAQSTASLAIHGSPFAAEEALGFDVTGLPPSTVGFLLTSPTRAQVPGLGGGQGDLCLGGTISRISQQLRTADSSGNATVNLDHAALPALVQLNAGSTWSFQWWHRDAGPVPTSNTSHAVELTFL